MATEAIIKFGRKHKNLFSAPYLEIGSKIQDSYTQYTPKDIHILSNSKDYIGIDIEDGDNVDLVIDLSKEGIIEKLNWNKKFMTIHCHCVLEHVADIFTMSKNIQKALKPGGKIFISAPFAWKIHRIPIDMWRFTPQSIDYMFATIYFNKLHCAVSTRNPKLLYNIDSFPELNLNLGSELNTYGFMLGLSIKIIKKLKLDNTFFSERALLKECNLMMIGEKQSRNTYTFYPNSI